VLNFSTQDVLRRTCRNLNWFFFTLIILFVYRLSFLLHLIFLFSVLELKPHSKASTFLLGLIVFLAGFLLTMNWPIFHLDIKRSHSSLNGEQNDRKKRRSSRFNGEPGPISVQGKVEESEDDEETPLLNPTLSENFIKHQTAIENTHRKLANPNSLTSFQ